MRYEPDGRRDYGREGRIGLATPQANPTAEAELSLLLPPSVSLHTTRLVSREADPMKRLAAYFEGLQETLGAFGSMPLSAAGVACTGSSYLIGAQREQELTDRLSERAGFPVVTAAQAIHTVIEARGVSRIAVIAPYPDALIRHLADYWSERGVEIVAQSRVPTRTSNTETIYELSSRDAAAALAALERGRAEAVLLSGTGMPTLAAIRDAALPVPVFSSNLCLAWRLLALAGARRNLGPVAPEVLGWAERVPA